MPPSRFREDVTPLGIPLTGSATPSTPTPGSASSSRTSSTWARLSALLDIEPDEIDKLFGEQYKGKEALLESNLKAFRMGRDVRARELRVSAADSRRAQRQGRRPHLHRRQQRRRARQRLRRRDRRAWYPITPSSSLAEAFQKLLPQAPPRSGDEEEALRDHAGRGRARVDRHRHRRRLERRARVHGDVGSRRVADAGVHGARVLRRDSGRAVRRAARQPVDRHADAHAAGRPALLRLRFARRHQARDAASRRPDRVASRSARRRSISPIGCRRRSS